MSDDQQLLQASLSQAVAALEAQKYTDRHVDFAGRAYAQNAAPDSLHGAGSLCLFSLGRELENNKMHFISILTTPPHTTKDVLVVGVTMTSLEAARDMYPSDHIPSMPLLEFVKKIGTQSAQDIFEATRPKRAAKPTGFKYQV